MRDTVRRKWSYFVDYYLLKTVIILAAASLAAFIIIRVVSGGDSYKFCTAVIGVTLDSAQSQYLSDTELAALSSAQGVEADKDDILTDSDFSLQSDGLNKLQVMLSNGAVDLIITDEDSFRLLAGYGYFLDLGTVLDDEGMSLAEGLTVSAAGYLDDDNLGFEDTETGKGPSEPYGIMFSSDGGQEDNLVVAIAASTENTEAAASVILSMARETKETEKEGSR